MQSNLLRMLAGVILALAATGALSAQKGVTVKRNTPPDSRFSSAIWAGDTLYVAGQMAAPATPADAVKGTPAIYGDTKTQTLNVLTKIQGILKEQGLTMGNVVQMHVFMAADPAAGNSTSTA